jgi:hypothetical protein
MISVQALANRLGEIVAIVLGTIGLFRPNFLTWEASSPLVRLSLVAAFPDLLRNDRERRGFTVGQIASRLGVKPQEYRELEAGSRIPHFETWDRICKLYGWPQTFVGG